MTEIRTAAEAVDVVKKWTTWPVRQCLNMVSRLYQRGTATKVSEIDPKVSVDNAREHWEATPSKYRHAGESNAPAGALIHLGKGDGHVFVSIGGGKGRSTDYPMKGKVGTGTINEILRHFSGNPLLGWSSWINGRAIQGIAPTTSTQTAARTAQVKAIAAYINKHAGNLKLPTTAASSDGIPGANYWKLIQALGRTWGFYAGAIDGIVGPFTYKAEDYIWDHYVNKQEPEPAPVAPVPDGTPEPVDVIDDEPTETEGPGEADVTDDDPTPDETPTEPAPQEEPVTPTPEPEPELGPQYTPPERLTTDAIATGLGALIPNAATRLKIYGWATLTALGLYVLSDVRDAVVQSIAAGNDPLKVAIDGGLAGIGLLIVPLGALAMANINPTPSID